MDESLRSGALSVATMCYGSPEPQKSTRFGWSSPRGMDDEARSSASCGSRKPGDAAGGCRKHGASGGTFYISKTKCGGMEFLGDALSEGRRFRILTVVDDAAGNVSSEWSTPRSRACGSRASTTPSSLKAAGRCCASPTIPPSLSLPFANAVFHLRSSSSNNSASSRSIVA
jgi:hypothetical protein